MKSDEDKTKEQLMNKLVEIRQRVVKLEASEAEHKRAEERTKELGESYRNMVELSPDNILSVDTKGVITSCNTAATRTLGYSKDEIVGKHFSKLGVIRLRDLPKYIKLFRTVLEGKETKPLELTFIRKDGTPLLIDIRLSLLKVRILAAGLLQSVVAKEYDWIHVPILRGHVYLRLFTYSWGKRKFLPVKAFKAKATSQNS